MMNHLISTLKGAGCNKASIIIQLNDDNSVGVVITPIFEAGTAADSGANNPVLKAALSLPLSVHADTAEGLDEAVIAQLSALAPSLAQVAEHAHDASVIVSVAKAAAEKVKKPAPKKSAAKPAAKAAPETAAKATAKTAADTDKSQASNATEAAPAASTTPAPTTVQGIDMDFLSNGL